MKPPAVKTPPATERARAIERGAPVPTTLRLNQSQLDGLDALAKEIRPWSPNRAEALRACLDKALPLLMAEHAERAERDGKRIAGKR